MGEVEQILGEIWEELSRRPANSGSALFQNFQLVGCHLIDCVMFFGACCLMSSAFVFFVVSSFNYLF